MPRIEELSELKLLNFFGEVVGKVGGGEISEMEEENMTKVLLWGLDRGKGRSEKEEKSNLKGSMADIREEDGNVF